MTGENVEQLEPVHIDIPHEGAVNETQLETNVLEVPSQLVLETHIAIEKVVVLPHHRFLMLQKDLVLLRQIKAMEKDVSEEQFTPYLTKKQKKQLDKENSYNTRFKGELKDD